MRDSRAQAAAAALILFGLVVALYRPVVFNARSLIHTNHSNPIDWRPLPDNYGPGMVPHDEWTRRSQWPFPNIRDPGATWWQWEPSTEFLKQAVADREWPFWDPYVAAGTPAMANLVQAFFFPPYLLLVLAGAGVALKNGYFLLLLWAASFAMYLFLRRHGLGFAGSLGGALVALMSGALNQNLGAFAGQTIACLPMVLYATRALLDRPDARRAALLSLVYAGTALASFPPILVSVFGIAALYAICGITLGAATPIVRRRQATWWGIGTAISGGLVAFYYLPAFALRHATPHVVAAYAESGADTIPFFKALQLLSPTVAGGVQLYWNDPFFVNGAAHIPYVGLAALIAAGFARPEPGSARVLFWSSLTAAALILLKLFGVPPVQWLGHAPLFNGIHFSHYLGVAMAAPIAGLAALGIDRIVRQRPGAVRTAIVAGSAAAALYLAFRVAAGAGVHAGPTAALWRADWNVLRLAALTAAAVLALAVVVNKRSARIGAVAVLMLVVVAEGFYNNTYLRPRRWDMFAHPAPYVRVLQREAGISRVFPFGVPEANVNEAYGIYSVASLMAFNPPRVHDLYRVYAAPSVPQVFLREATRLPPDGVLDRANVSFVGTYSAIDAVTSEAARRGYDTRFTDGFFTLYRRATTTPRFYFSSAYRVHPTSDALAAIAGEPSREIVLEESPSFAPAPNADGDPEVRLDSYRRNSIALSVDAPRPGLVYASESFFDGWSATVNGAPARILPANYAFRAVEVPAGAARIEFRYWPPGLTAGLWLSGLSLLAVALLLARKEPRDGA